MTERVWKPGPPPHIGWWNASAVLMSPSPHAWRWWDGRKWSFNCQQGDSDEWLKNAIPQKENYETDKMVWSDYWPKNARVPRVDPADPDYAIVVEAINKTIGPCTGDYWATVAWNRYHSCKHHVKIREEIKMGSNQRLRIGDPFAGINTMDLMKEVVRRLHVV